jgi:dihydrofolate reductase
MKISLVVAMAGNRVIGRDQALPWHLPADLAHFKALTMGKPILMGRKTWESIGRPLPGRLNLVLTRDPGYQAGGATTVTSVDAAIDACTGAPELMVIGGAGVYRDLLPAANRLYLTEVSTNVDGDTYFPELDMSEWREVSREQRQADEKNACDMSFVILDRV